MYKMCNVYQLTVHKYLKLFLKGQSHEILRAANAKQVSGIPLEVYYLFLNFYFHTDFKFKVFPGLIFFCYTQQMLSVRPQIFLLRRACSALQIRFKTTAANLARWTTPSQSLAITFAADYCSSGRRTSPGCCTCRQPFCWRAVKIGDCSYWSDTFLAEKNWMDFQLVIEANDLRHDTQPSLSPLKNLNPQQL